MILDIADIEREPILLVQDGYNIFKETRGIDYKGVYSCFSLRTGKVYIGSSYSIRRRVGEHILALEGNKHYNRCLQAEFNQYPHSFIWYFIEPVFNDEALKLTEQCYLDTLEPFPWDGNGYNLTKSAFTAGWAGKKYSEKEMEYQAIKRRGGNPPFRVRSPEGEIHEFTCSPRRFAFKNGLNDGKLRQVLNGERNHHLGWHLAENPVPEWEIKSPEGEVFKFWNINKFCIENDLCAVGITRVLKGSHLESRGWTLPETIIKKNKFILQNQNGKTVEFESIKKFSEEHGFPQRAIYSLFYREKEEYRGWRLVDGAEITKLWTFTDPNGKIVRTRDLGVFSEENGLPLKDVNKLIEKKIKSVSGWTVGGRTIGESFVFISPGGEEFTTDNVKKFSEDQDLNYQGFHRLTHGAKHYKGWTLKTKL